MAKNKSRKVSRKIDVDNLYFDGDLALKLTYIVSQSRKNSDSNERYFNDTDFIERAVEAKVKDWEDKNNNIDIAPSGLSVIPPKDE